MERISVLLTVFLVSLQGSSAVTDVFVQKGNDFLLEVPKSFVPGESDFFLWKFKQKINIVRFITGSEPKTFDNYIGRVQFSKQNYSVKLNNLQAADSGVYEAQESGNEDRTVAEYNVTVQDPVSPVKLKVDSDISRSESCIINATCSTVDSDISSSFGCVNQTCDQDGGEQSKLLNSGASLRIYLSNGSIICNHSNQVSWTKDMTEIQGFCKGDTVFPQSKSNDIGAGIGIGIGIPAVIILSGVIFKVVQHRKKRKYDTENIENTVYATPQGQTTQTQDESSPNDASGASPDTIYSLAGPHTGSTETRTKPQPESLYSVVQKPTKPCRNLQEL